MPLLLSLLTLLFVVSGCGGGAEKGKDSSAASTLNVSWNTDIGDLNPHLYSSQMFAQGMVYEALVKYGQGGKIEPWLAESWTISPDGREYTFKLRRDVKFSDGSPFNAQAVKKNFDAVLANAKLHDWLEMIAQMKEVTATDDYTIKITFKNPYYPALQELALIRPIRFLAPAGFPDSGDTSQSIKVPIGTGPWVLSEHKKNEYAVFTRNDNYWGPKPKLQKVLVKIIPDGESRVIAFEKGELNLIYGSGLISLDSFKQLKESGKYETKLSDPTSTRALAVNSNRGPTKELKVRQALQYAFNKQALIDGLFYGTETPADTLFSPNFPYCDLNLEPYGYSPEKAGALLEEAGWKQAQGKEFREKDGQPLLLELCFDSTDSVQKSIAETIQGDFKKVGVNLKLVGEEKQSFNQRQKDGNFNLIFSDTWGAPYDPHSMVSSMRHPSHADYQAQSGLSMKADIDKKIGEVLVSTDATQRQELYRYILGTLHQQAVYLPISNLCNMAIYKKNISGVEFALKYDMPFEKMEIQQ
jgi:nickel transport system substrate-binding protein